MMKMAYFRQASRFKKGFIRFETYYFKVKRRCINAIWHCYSVLKNTLMREMEVVYIVYSISISCYWIPGIPAC